MQSPTTCGSPVIDCHPLSPTATITTTTSKRPSFVPSSPRNHLTFSLKACVRIGSFGLDGGIMRCNMLAVGERINCCEQTPTVNIDAVPLTQCTREYHGAGWSASFLSVQDEGRSPCRRSSAEDPSQGCRTVTVGGALRKQGNEWRVVHGLEVGWVHNCTTRAELFRHPLRCDGPRQLSLAHRG
jgi:hypothetical protein